jgi:glycosyltransferase involved in cell wall biosynthesis
MQLAMSHSGRIIVNGRFVHARLTGVQRYAHEITRLLKEQVTLIAPEKKAFGAAGGWKGHGWEQFYLARQVAPGDLLWSPANCGPLSVARQVVTVHDLAVLEHPEWFSRAYAAWYRFLIPRLARRAIRVLTVSQFSRKRILSLLRLPDEKVIAIPAGVGSDFQAASAQSIAALRSRYLLESPYMLVVGTLERRKNLLRLLQAWKIAAVDHPRVELVIAGGGGRAFRPIDLHDLPPRVRLLGYVADDELPALYSGALALVLPSLYEGFGLPALEAMACGTPVIVACTGALPEVVGEAGLYFNPLDVRQMAQALHGALDDPALRREMSHKGLRRARLFTWQAAADQVYAILRQAHGESRA